MGQLLVVVISAAAGIVLGVFSNWFYDLLRERNILPERPTFKKILVVTLGFAPLLILVALPTLLQLAEPQPQTTNAAEDCAIVPQERFGEAWQTYKLRLGCALHEAKLVEVAEQPFERGHMFWQGEQSTIYVVYDRNGIWESFPDKWITAPTAVPYRNNAQFTSSGAYERLRHSLV